MTKEQIKTVLDRISAWPEQRQQQLAEIAIEIEAEMSDAPYWASEDELAAIDEGAAGEPASESEVAAAFARLRRR
jgi:hypothetical protein